MENKPKYRHYRTGAVYTLFAIATHTETSKPLAVYGEYAPTWARPLDMFYGEVCVDGRFVPRFERLED